MKTSKTTQSRDTFVSAITTAKNIISQFPKTKLAWYCEKFIEFNKKAKAQHDKLIAKKTKDLNMELSTVCVDNAAEKDGVILYNKDGGYQYGRAGEKIVIAKREEITEKINEIVDELLKETVEVVVITSELNSLPDGLSPFQFSVLNNSVFKNKNEFEEEIIHE